MTITPIFLDGFATLPLAPEARDAMLAAWTFPGNAGSPNGSGERAARIIADARADVAALIGAAPAEIIFTSGATEANNLAILGIAHSALARNSSRRRIVVSSVEHKAVLEPANILAGRGFDVVVAPVDQYGRVDLPRLESLVDECTLLVSVMMVNNETGVVQPVSEVASITHAAGALFHTDAAQAGGKVAIDVLELDVDYLSLSAHKCYGPMGVGALYCAAGAPTPEPLIYGGGQQNAVRPGTEPVALIAGFGAAAKMAMVALCEDASRGRTLIGALLDRLAQQQIRFERITGDRPVVPASAAIRLEDVNGDDLCAMVARNVSLSTGSACTAGQVRVSHVLERMGLSDVDARSVVRIYCHRYLTERDIDAAAAHIIAAIVRSRVATGEVRQ
ncbi:cysteine desulfurase family protein [Sphingomonas sp. 10B4]|uniref:cysteine desulfurase family protein n=1 Tax=Sphingomonas sp. 10B4 TaxID=3048575 RepID=UPI002B22C6DE|nr:cysteine desulfurase family protein [Sphingomonas sp. 10B4]